jgi:hypothetical protein
MIRFLILDDDSREVKERYAYFAESDRYLQTLGKSKIDIRKIVLNN